MPYTFLEIVETVSTRLGGTYTEIHQNYLLRLPMENGAIQEVIVITIANQSGEPMLKYFSVAGPVQPEPELLDFLIRNNMGMDYGGFSLMKMEGADNLIVFDSVPLASANPDELVPSVRYITKLAYETKTRISSGMNPF